MAVPAKQRRKVVLKGLESIIEWQCAHDAVRHAEPGQRVVLEYETPEGTLVLGVQPVGQEKLVISRAKAPGGKQ
ncbi:hypothetical protein [Marinobacter nauticus]|uniref:Uncharacterized protein n=1 Tax=Marinobacter nauticus TaxID=2743 RepID=A0A833JTA0_MARNT|nr:hypothetical protein [Marinobacter nauticus]KAE8546116.1 hypothetical protein F6453_1362 [Marinobacter nauticus]